MKKKLKYFLYTILGLLSLVLLVVVYIQIKGIPSYEVKMPEELVSWKADTSFTQIQRGGKIAAYSCYHCHRSEDGTLSGNLFSEASSAFGLINSANITQHPVHGIGNWTDGELKYFLRTSISKDGSYFPPYMPALNRMSDEDLNAVIAWLRSDDPWVQPTDYTLPPSDPSFLVKALSNFVFKPTDYPAEIIIAPDTSDIVAYGQYMADDVVSCYSCHSSSFESNDDINPENSKGFYGGGNPMKDEDGNLIYSANITFDKTGIADYSETDFIKAVRWGQKKDGNTVRLPMIPHTTLSDFEVKAIYQYLKTIPHIENDISMIKS